jgi:PAS domain S-box-containing protein
MEFWNITPVAIIYFLAAGLSFFISVAAWNLHPARGARIFSGMMTGVSLWSLSYLLGTFAIPYDFKLVMLQLEYVGMASAVFLWFVFVATYTQYDYLLRPWILTVLTVIPIITIISLLRAPNSTYIHETYELVNTDGILTWKKNFTIGFYIWTAYAYLMMLSGIVLLSTRIVKMPKAMRSQLYFLIPVIIVIMLPNIAFIIDENPIEPFDPTSLALVIVGLLFLASMYYYKFLDVAPVAHELVFKNMRSGVIIIDSRLSVLETNIAILKIFKQSESKLLGCHVLEIIPQLKEMFDESEFEEMKSEMNLGSDKRTYEVKLTPIKNSGGQLYGYIIALWDITEQKMALFELDAYARSVAHDLKNPLSQMMGIAHLLKENMLNADEKDEYLDQLISGGLKAKGIIDGILMMAKLRNIESMEVATIDMQAVVENALTRLNDSIEASNCKITLPEYWPMSKGNELWIEEVWVNLISNAIKYGGSPPQISINGSIRNGSSLWSVSDNGNGLNKKEQEAVFGEFTRLHPNREQIRGHGLGLPIVQRIISKSGGEVSVQSETQKGSTFSFTLPIN